MNSIIRITEPIPGNLVKKLNSGAGIKVIV